jgi:WD40 repeat protein
VLRLWNVDSGSESRRIVQGPGLLAVAFRPESNLVLAAGKDNTVSAWDSKTGKQALALPGHFGWVAGMAFTPDGATLVTTGYDNSVKLWDWSDVTRNDVLPGHEGWTLALAFSPNDRLLASGGRDGVVKFWDAATGDLLEQWKGKQPVTALAFAPDDQPMHLAVGAWSEDGSSSLKLLEVRLSLGKVVLKDLHSLEGHKKGVTCLAFTKATLASGSGDGTVILWDAAAGKSKRTLKVEREVRALAFTSTGGTIATGDARGYVKLWDASTGTPLPRTVQNQPIPEVAVHDGAITGLAFVNDDFVFLSTGADHTMKLWTWKQDQTATALRTYRSHQQPISTLARLGDSSFATASWDHAVKLWDLREPFGVGDERFTLVGHTAPVRALAISANRQILASAGHDGVIRLWRATPVPRVQ